MPERSDNYPFPRDPLHLMRVLKRVTRLIVYPAVALLIPLDHFLLGSPWLTALISHGVGGYLVATLGIEFGFWGALKLRKEAAYPTMLSMELGATGDFGQACERSVRLVAGLLRAEKVVLAWRNHEDGSLTTVATHGIPPEDVPLATSLSWWQQSIRQAIDERKVVVASAGEGHAWQSGSDGRSRVAYVPLVSLDQLVGVLILVGGRKASDLGDKTLLAPIGLAIGLTLKNLRHTVELRRRSDEYIATTNLTGDVILKLDKDGRWVFLNDAACQFYGRPREELLGVGSTAFLHPEDIEPTTQAIREMRASKEPVKGFVNRQVTPMGTRAVEWNGYPIFDEQDQYAGIQITGRDITERKRAEEERERLTAELEVRAITDSQTGLYNHAHFYERLTEEIERSKRYGAGCAVVMMDLNNFKQYNDSRGHQAGDEVLCLVADCIRTAIRRSDIAFRYGGDEFAAILPHADSPRAQAVVNRINRRIAARLKEMNDPAAAWLGVSAGVASYPDDAATAGDLVTIADTALYDSKRVASARAVTGQGWLIESIACPPAAPQDTQRTVLSTAARELAVALQDVGVPDLSADLNVHTVAAIGAAAEIKDPYIRGHQQRASRWAAAVAERMGVSPEVVRDIRIAGLLHDIGKVTISEGILNKPGKLTQEEFAKIKEHPALGAMMIISEVEGLQRIVPIVRHHHERFDGKGYPDGLAGKDIPLAARIMSVVDVFDAMTHDRAYRKALSREQAIAELERGAGTQFDPAVVEAFLALLKRPGQEPAAPAQAARKARQMATARAAGRRKG